MTSLALFPLLRLYLVVSGSITDPILFGYFLTAFHLRADTILASFCAALVSSMVINKKDYKLSAQQISALTGCWLFIVSAWILLVIYRSQHYKLYYVFNPLLLAVVCTIIVIYCANSDPVRLRPPPLVYNCIVASLYSVYLTHPFAIEAAERLLKDNANGFSYGIVVVFLIVSFSFFFYSFVEKPFAALVAGGLLARRSS
jgi:peptidoglycan/LPS O-acetylase OafA/YrhL